MPAVDPPQPIYKLVILGDSSVGKSSILSRAAGRGFMDQYLCTIGCDFQVVHINVDGKPVRLQLWDTAGQERFRCLNRAYYRGAHGIILTYDVTSRASFQDIENWVKEIEVNAGPEGANMEKILIGNKADLTHQREVSYDEGKQLADTLGIPFAETSAKEALNVTEAFTALAKNIREKLLKVHPERQAQGEQAEKDNKGGELKKESLMTRIFGSCCEVM